MILSNHPNLDITQTFLFDNLLPDNFRFTFHSGLDFSLDMIILFDPRDEPDVHLQHAPVEGEDPEEEEALETVRDDVAEDQHLLNGAAVGGEQDEDAEYPGDPQNNKDPQIYEEIWSSPVPVSHWARVQY